MKKLTLLIATILAIPCLSSAAEWKILSEKSKIEFRTMQNSTAILGSFKKFSGKINFDPTQLKTSKVEIEIDTNSVEASLNDAAPTLKTPEWLSAKAFPKATFIAEKFTKISDKKFTADGSLTIKGKSVPTKLNFTLEEYSQTKAKVSGSVAIRRTDFMIGAKDPANSHGVQDEVAVSFVVNTTR